MKSQTAVMEGKIRRLLRTVDGVNKRNSVSKRRSRFTVKTGKRCKSMLAQGQEPKCDPMLKNISRSWRKSNTKNKKKTRKVLFNRNPT